MAILEKTKQWLLANEDLLTSSEYCVYDRLSDKMSFMVLGAKKENVLEIAEALEFEVVSITINNIEDLIRESWMHIIQQNPNDTYVVLFDVDNADEQTFTALSSMIKHKEIDHDNTYPFVSIVMCSDINRPIPRSIESVLGPFKWEDK